MINSRHTSTIQADTIQQPCAAATQHLRAGVFLDRAFRNMVIYKVHNGTAHRTAPSYGFDLITVVRGAWLAWAEESLELAAVAAILAIAFTMDLHAVLMAACVIGTIALLRVCLRAVPETARLHAVAAGERLLRRRGTVDHSRRHETARLMLLCLGGAALLAIIAAWAAGSAADPRRQVAAAAVLLGALAVIGASAGIARQVSLNHIKRQLGRPARNLRGRLRVIQAQQESPYVVYSRFRSDEDDHKLSAPGRDEELTPFVGSGILVHRWPYPLTVQLLKDCEGTMEEREHRTPPFQTHELVEYLKKAMEPAGEDPGRLRGFQIKDRLYVAETDVSPHRGFLRDPARQEDIDAIIDEPHGDIVYYLELRLTVSGELVTTAFVRVTVRGRALTMDFSACALTRTPPDYRLLDAPGETGAFAVIRAAARGAVSLPATAGGLWRLASAPWAIAGALRAGRDHTLYPRWHESIGPRLSIREEKAIDWSDTSSEDKRHIYADVKIIEERLLKAAEDFLKSRDIDVTALKRRAQTIISAGILNMGRLDMNNSNTIIGDGSNINTSDDDTDGQ
jgi:hypothetical protein